MFSPYKVLSSLSYMSIFFAPFFAPLIIYLMSEDNGVKQHAQTAYSSHVIPVISLAILSTLFFELGEIFNFYTVTGIILFGGIAFTVTIWNVIKGIKVLQQK